MAVGDDAAARLPETTVPLVLTRVLVTPYSVCTVLRFLSLAPIFLLASFPFSNQSAKHQSDQAIKREGR